ncbi:hypothetical protein [Paenibacillus xylanexedens]|uniref:hypothetical protein n=1 Tax=Paenibacillus xylanexedens TaxID=528191 RepID=UPI0011A65E29|nr:hypothetical protein [Paenibacillus xylanexedens]
MIVINKWVYISIPILFLFLSYLKTVLDNIKISKTKEIKKFRFILTFFYGILGPWATKLILAQPDKLLSLEEEIHEYYVTELKKSVKFGNASKKIEKVLEVLKKRELNSNEIIILRSYIDSDEVDNNTFIQTFSLLISSVIAVFIGISAVGISDEYNVDINSAFIGGLSLVLIYVVLHFSISRTNSKPKIIRIVLDRYESTVLDTNSQQSDC